MKGLIDTNILVYGTIHSLPEYPEAAKFLHTALAGPDLYAVTWINLAEYLSLLTHSWKDRSAYMTMGDAVANANEILKNPCVNVIVESASHWSTFNQVLSQAGPVRGKFVHDCRIAAIMLENGVDTIYTHDTDFRKIPGLEVIDPLVKK